MNFAANIRLKFPSFHDMPSPTPLYASDEPAYDYKAMGTGPHFKTTIDNIPYGLKLEKNEKSFVIKFYTKTFYSDGITVKDHHHTGLYSFSFEYIYHRDCHDDFDTISQKSNQEIIAHIMKETWPEDIYARYLTMRLFLLHITGIDESVDNPMILKWNRAGSLIVTTEEKYGHRMMDVEITPKDNQILLALSKNIQTMTGYVSSDILKFDSMPLFNNASQHEKAQYLRWKQKCNAIIDGTIDDIKNAIFPKAPKLLCS